MTYPPYQSPEPDEQRPVAPYPQAAEGYPRYGAAASPPAYPPSYPPPGYYYPPPPEPLRGLGRAAAWLAVAVTVVGVGRAALAWPAQSSYADAAERGEEWLDVWTWYDGIGLVQFPFMVAAYVVTCLWLYRARTNSAVMQPHLRHARSPGWAWGGWVCPVVNFWFPFQMVRDVGRAQDGSRAVSGIGAWWTLWMLGTITSAVGGQMVSLEGEIDAGLLSALGPLETAGALLTTAALVLWLRVVRDVSLLQDRMMGAAPPLTAPS
jgi:hypothetical protein